MRIVVISSEFSLEGILNHTLSRSEAGVLEEVGRGFLASTLIAITLIAVLGNLLVIISIAYFKKLQTPTNTFLLSLAVSDFLVGVLVMPFSLVRTVDSWKFGETFCKVHFILDVTFCTTSIYNLSCIAFDRYFTVRDPLRYTYRMSTSRMAKILFLCWILPLLVSCVPVVLDLHVKGTEKLLKEFGPNICILVVNIPYAVVASMLCFYIPAAIMLAAYGKLFRVARKQARQIDTVENQVNSRIFCPLRARQRFTMKKERKATKTLSIIMGVFLVCWLPFFIVNIINPFMGYSTSPIVLEVFLWLGYINSSMNPFLHGFFNKSFRRAFVIILGCKMIGRQFQDSDLSGDTRRQAHTELSTFSR
ncbi:trace amine-associated receptor 3-like [Polyodon spathula]|uniref:trace amine-associated receptor 3-like n=1 Tax=Polyodon spathula TaxID=7913 RepID=UPI001B7D9E48|nr:trace amine-associated receptor 3-like [Polyodon spathula]